MKKLLLATSAIVALVTVAPASAADLRVPVKAAPVYRPACAQFGGVYLGAQVGGAYYVHDWQDRDAWTQEVDSDNDLPANTRNTKWGAAGGLTAGWNWQNNCAVFGIEADYSWTSLTASAFISDGAIPLDESVSISSKLRGFGTLRARTGVVVDNVLLYVTGGLAFANFDRTWTLSQNAGETVETFAYDRWRWGLAVGAGAEWALFGSNWSIKSEFLYMAFQKDERSFVSAFFDAGDTKRFESNDSVWVSRIGINYRWGGGNVANY
jgi:outer membrane immunogenic protein